MNGPWPDRIEPALVPGGHVLHAYAVNGDGTLELVNVGLADPRRDVMADAIADGEFVRVIGGGRVLFLVSYDGDTGEPRGVGVLFPDES